MPEPLQYLGRDGDLAVYGSAGPAIRYAIPNDPTTLDAEGEHIDDSENCDEGTPCNYPPCVMARDFTEREMRATFAGSVLMGREEWDAVYADDLGKRASYDRLHA